jgi:serine protease Do
MKKVLLCLIAGLAAAGQSYPMFNEDQVKKVFDGIKPAIVYIELSARTTNTDGKEDQQIFAKNGLIYDEDGYIVTSFISKEVISDIKVIVGQKEYKARLVGNDKTSRVSVVKIVPEGKLVPAKFSDKPVLPNQWLIAVFSLGEENQYEKMFFPCYVGGVLPAGLYDQFYLGVVQTGDGVVLCSMDGQVSGLMLPFYDFSIPMIENRVNKVNNEVAMMKSGAKAVSVNPVVNAVKRIMAGKDSIKISWVGFQLKKFTKQESEGFGIPHKGVLVTKVYRNGPADKAGVKLGDVIIEVDGREILKDSDGMELLIDLLRVHQPDTPGEIKVYRGKEIITLNITPIEFPEPKQTRSQWLGITVQEITDLIYNGMNLFTDKGVVVADLERANPANNAGIEQGDVIIALQNLPVPNTVEWQNVVNKLNMEKVKNILVKLYRGNKTMIRVIKTDESNTSVQDK